MEIRMLACALLLLSAARQATGQELAFSRPKLECPYPAVEKVNEINVWPEEYRIQSIVEPLVDVDKASTTVTVAQDFSVTYYKTFKVVQNKRMNETYVLYQCGTPNPAEAKPGDVTGLPSSYKVFQIPLLSTMVDDTSVGGFLDELGVIDRVAYAAQRSVNPCLQRIAGCGNQTASKWDTDSTGTLGARMASQAAATDAVWVYSKNQTNPDSIAFSATSDPGTLARAEWVKFVAPFYNKELEANKIFADIKSSYDKATAAAIEANAAAKPKVAWVAYSSYAGPGVVFYLAPYKNQFIQDAGGQPLAVASVNISALGVEPDAYSPTTSFKLNLTKAGASAGDSIAELLKDVDIIIDETYMLKDFDDWKTKFQIPANAVDAIPALKNKQVYAITGRRGPALAGSSGDFGNDWFESAVVRPDLVLKDFAKVIAPTSQPNHELAYLLRLDGVDAPTVLTTEICKIIPACSRAAPVAICPNVYRDCATGTLMQAKPADRCTSASTCPDVSDVSANAQNTTAHRNGAGPAAGLSKAMLGLAAAATSLLLYA